MISDWSVELNKGPNPSSSVDQAVALEDKMEITRKQLESKLNVLRSLHANWAEMEDIMAKLDVRVAKINQLVSQIEKSADEEKMTVWRRKDGSVIDIYGVNEGRYVMKKGGRTAMS